MSTKAALKIQSRIPKRTPKRVPNTQRRLRSMEAVTTAALDLFVAQGFKETTIDEIAAKANLSKGSVYFYFKDKSELLINLLEQSQALYQSIFDLMKASNKSAHSQLEDFIDWCAHAGADNKELLLLPILMSLEFFNRDDEIGQAINKIYKNYHAELESLCELGQKTSEFDASVSPKEQAAVILAFTEGTLLEWYRWGKTLDGRKLSRAAKNLLLHGMQKS